MTDPAPPLRLAGDGATGSGRTSGPRVVSVIIGTKNRPDTLREAIASIRALEGPDLTFEILVGDNGANPRTREVVEAAGGWYGQTGINGCPASRNLAMQRISGEFVAFLDDDDVWTAEHVRPHIALLDARPELAAVFGRVQSTDQALHPRGEPWPQALPEDGDLFQHMLAGYFPQVGATVVRASVAHRLGLMDEALIGDSDWDWQLRIARTDKIGFVPVTCVLFRQRPPGTFDDLQITRVKYTRRIFWRHAWPERHRWPSLISVLKSYFSAVQGYYSYFTDAATARASKGDRKGTVRALLYCARIMPHRVARSLLSKSVLRSALVTGFTGGQRPAENLKTDA